LRSAATAGQATRGCARASQHTATCARANAAEQRRRAMCCTKASQHTKSERHALVSVPRRHDVSRPPPVSALLAGEASRVSARRIRAASSAHSGQRASRLRSFCAARAIWGRSGGFRQLGACVHRGGRGAPLCLRAAPGLASVIAARAAPAERRVPHATGAAAAVLHESASCAPPPAGRTFSPFFRPTSPASSYSAGDARAAGRQVACAASGPAQARKALCGSARRPPAGRTRRNPYLPRRPRAAADTARSRTRARRPSSAGRLSAKPPAVPPRHLMLHRQRRQPRGRRRPPAAAPPTRRRAAQTEASPRKAARQKTWVQRQCQRRSRLCTEIALPWRPARRRGRSARRGVSRCRTSFDTGCAAQALQGALTAGQPLPEACGREPRAPPDVRKAVT
jgi:hypothetical protein